MPKPSPPSFSPVTPQQSEHDAAAILAGIQTRVIRAARERTPLRIIGGDTKAALGRAISAEPLSLARYSGIVVYEPSELVITARAGTPLTEIESTLAHADQMLAFEPPRFGSASTIGGVVAAGLSGPRRPYAGSVRDAVLGVRIMNTRGEVLRFGGQVMKNVAGYDVSRLMTGAMGTLGPIVEVSLRVMPRPEQEVSLHWRLTAAAARERMLGIARHAWPISGLCFDGDKLRLRLSGATQAIAKAITVLAPEEVEHDQRYWQALRDMTLPWFTAAQTLWRIGIPPAAPVLDGDWVWDWGGAQRWLRSDLSARRIRDYLEPFGGTATCFAGVSDDQPFAPLTPTALQVQQRIKDVFDPSRIFNPGRIDSRL